MVVFKQMVPCNKLFNAFICKCQEINLEILTAHLSSDLKPKYLHCHKRTDFAVAILSDGTCCSAQSFREKSCCQLLCVFYFLLKCLLFSYFVQDLLRCRVLTSGIFETRFQVDKVNFQ